MPGTVFTPATVRVLTGDSVMFANHDTRPHTATAVDASFDTGSILPHADATVAFPVAGSYAYFCRIHSFMRGRVDVVALLLAGPATPPAKGAAATLDGPRRNGHHVRHAGARRRRGVDERGDDDARCRRRLRLRRPPVGARHVPRRGRGRRPPTR